MKKSAADIEKYKLDTAFHQVHKEGKVDSDFALDNSQELICGGFGLYSSRGLKPKVGPIKSEFFRVGLGIRGSVQLDCGLESFHFQAGDIIFTFPGQLFSLHDKSADFFAYYMLFSEEFVADFLSLKNLREQFPFLNYGGIQHIRLNTAEAHEIETFIEKLNVEIKGRKPDIKQAIQSYIYLILIQAHRSYLRQGLGEAQAGMQDNALLRKFKKLVSEHFISKRNVPEYAELLHISADHLSKTIRRQSGKTAHALIEEMLILEAKALILHTQSSIAEIAFALEFSDPSHFNKFFRKHTALTPVQFREKVAKTPVS